MREITKIMIKKYALTKLKYDFMGYPFDRTSQLSFHHLIIPKRLCPIYDIGQGYYDWNGAILRQNTAHEYLHIIERYDRDMFEAITNEMIEENIKGYLDGVNLKAIDDILNQFEKEYCSARTKNNHPLIKDSYVKRLKIYNK